MHQREPPCRVKQGAREVTAASDDSLVKFPLRYVSPKSLFQVNQCGMKPIRFNSILFV